MIKKVQLLELIDNLIKNDKIFDKDKSPVIESETEKLYNIHIFTKKYQYTITADFEENYLGCIATTRKRRNGESWYRSADLEDGKLSMGIWNRIVNDIMENEDL